MKYRSNDTLQPSASFLFHTWRLFGALLVVGAGLNCLTPDVQAQEVCNLKIENKRNDTIVVFSINPNTGEEYPVARVYGGTTEEGLMAQGSRIRFKAGCQITENGTRIEGGKTIFQAVTPKAAEGKITLTPEMVETNVTPFPPKG